MFGTFKIFLTGPDQVFHISGINSLNKWVRFHIWQDDIFNDPAISYCGVFTGACWKVYFVKPVIEIFAKQKRTMTGIFQGRQLFLKKTGCFFVILLCSGTGKKSGMRTENSRLSSWLMRFIWQHHKWSRDR